MVTTTMKFNLHNFYAEMWNEAEITGGNSRYFRPLGCWLQRKVVQVTKRRFRRDREHIDREYGDGRVVVYPFFPKNPREDMKPIDNNLLAPK